MYHIQTWYSYRAALAPGAVGVLRDSISVAPVYVNVPRFRADRKVRRCGTAVAWTPASFCLAPAHGALHLHVAIAELDIVRIAVLSTMDVVCGERLGLSVYTVCTTPTRHPFISYVVTLNRTLT